MSFDSSSTVISFGAYPNPESIALFYSDVRTHLKELNVVVDGSQAPQPTSEWIACLVSLQKLSQRSDFQGTLRLEHFSDPWKALLSDVSWLDQPQQDNHGKHWLESVGEKGLLLWDELKHLMYLLTESIYWSTLGKLEKHASKQRGVAIQLVRLGGDAIPIVTLLSFLIGLTLAFQSAVQLEPLGASVYLVRGVGISMFSEIGPLITAIILAGRSGSSMTAEISSMVVQEEVKALRTMGIHPVHFLVVPRFQAMSIAVPLLTYLSTLAGILAGFFIALLYANIPVSTFFSELQSGVPLALIWQCGVKGLVFGWIITLVAVQKGLSVQGGADAVGRATTSCVVFSISAIILMDAVFSFLFYW